MRNMTSPHFCPVCQEGMWLQFFAKVSIIDEVELQYLPDDQVAVAVKTIRFGPERAAPLSVRDHDHGPAPTEALLVSWTRDGLPQLEFRDKLRIQFDRTARAGRWEVAVTFVTSEVRNDPNDLLKGTSTFTV